MYPTGLLAGLGKFYEVESIDGEAIFGVRLPLAVVYGLLCTAAFFLSRVILPQLSRTYRRLPRQARIDWDNRMVALGAWRRRRVVVACVGWGGCGGSVW
jgi:hypothetical protein